MNIIRKEYIEMIMWGAAIKKLVDGGELSVPKDKEYDAWTIGAELEACGEALCNGEALCDLKFHADMLKICVLSSYRTGFPDRWKDILGEGLDRVIGNATVFSTVKSSDYPEGWREALEKELCSDTDDVELNNR